MSSTKRPFFDRLTKGFTLIELLVVVAIIALLIAILLPSLAKARGRARSAACLSNLKELATASLLYAGEYSQFICPSSVTNISAVPGGPKKGQISWNYYLDPTTLVYSYPGSFLSPYTQGQKVLLCPEVVAGTPMVASVSTGNMICEYSISLVSASVISQISDPSQTVVFADTANPSTSTQLSCTSQIARPSSGAGAVFHGRHNTLGNAAFYDGHAESIRPQLPPSSLFTFVTTYNLRVQWGNIGSLCYGTIGNMGSATFPAYAVTNNLDFYFWADKMEKN